MAISARFHFLPVAVLAQLLNVLSFTPAQEARPSAPEPAKILTGDAAREKAAQLLDGRSLTLSSIPGAESVAADFSFQIHVARGGWSFYRQGGRTVEVIWRMNDTPAPMGIFTNGWAAMISEEHPGELDVIAGCDCSLSFSQAAQKFTTNPLGVGTAGIAGEMTCEFPRDFGTNFFSGADAVPEAWETNGRWFFRGRRTAKSAVSIVVNPQADFPVEEIKMVDRQTGEPKMIISNIRIGSQDALIAGLNLPKMFETQIPVRMFQTSNVIREILQATDTAKKHELMMASIQPYIKQFTNAMTGADGRSVAEWPQAMREASMKLAALVPPPPTPARLAEETPSAPETGKPSSDSDTNGEDKPAAKPVENDTLIKCDRFMNSLAAPVVLNGKRGWFFIDTGADHSAIAPDVAKELPELNLSPFLSVYDHAGSKARQTTRVATLEIGDWKLTSLKMGIMSGPPAYPEYLGVLGMDLLSLQPFTLDAEAGNLLLHRRENFTPPADASPQDMPVLLFRGSTELSMPGTILQLSDGPAVPVLLDTGMDVPFYLNRPWLEKNRPDLLALQFSKQNMCTGTGLVPSERRLWPGTEPMTLAAQPVAGASAFTTRTDAMEDFPAIAGIPLLRRFMLTVDMKNHRLWAAPRKPLSLEEIPKNKVDGISPLALALSTSDETGARRLLEEGAKLNFSSAHHDLDNAVVGGNAGIVRLVLDRDLESTWKESNAFTTAVSMGNAEMVRLLMQAGADPTPADNQPLRTAALQGNVEIAKMLREAGAPLSGNTPKLSPHVIFEAVASGSEAMVGFVIKGDDSWKSLQFEEKTALTSALLKGVPAIVSLLLNAGANVEEELGEERITALHLAAYAGNPEVLGLIAARCKDVNLRSAKGRTALHHAASTGRKENVAVLLKFKADPNALEKRGISPLYITCASLRKSENPADLAACGVLLLEAGADPNLKPPGDVPPLLELIAASPQAMGLARLAIEKGAKPDNPGLLSMLASSGNAGLVQVVLQKGGKIDAADDSKITPLMAAAKAGQTAVVHELLKHQPNVNAADEDGIQAIHFAARHNDRDLIEMLVKAGANPNALADKEGPPLAVAIKAYALHGARTLLENGADPELKRGSFTPLEIADFLEPSHTHMVELVKEFLSRKEAALKGP